MDDNTFEVKCRKYLLKRLGVLERDIKKTVSKEKAARKTQVERLCKYKDSDEAAEAYGYCDITEEEYVEVLAHLEEGAAFVEFTKTPKAAALEILHDFMTRQESEIASLEWMIKSPEEQADILKANAEFRERHKLKGGGPFYD